MESRDSLVCLHYVYRVCSTYVFHTALKWFDGDGNPEDYSGGRTLDELAAL